MHSVSLKTAGERARIKLKEIETLTYACSSPADLLHLENGLDELKTMFQENLPQEDGMIIRPAVIAAGLRTRKKYAAIRARQRLRNCSALPEAKKRKKVSKRVGIRADLKRKVSYNYECYINLQFVLH